jgi:uncharacterized protein with PQ loop repeat
MCEAFFEAIGYLGGILLAICTLPQMWQMYCTKSAADLQKRFLFLYLAGSVLTFVYLVMKDAWAAWITMTLEVFSSYNSVNGNLSSV